MLATDVPKEVWIEGLAAAAPLSSPADEPLAHVAWLRSLASLAASCRFFRRLLWSPHAGKLYSQAAAAPHFHWRTWRPFGAQGCTALALSLWCRAHALRELHLDCTAVEPRVLGGLLLRCVDLERLSLAAVTPAATGSMSVASRMRLRNLRRLDCPGPDSRMRFAALPPSLASLTCRISDVRSCLQLASRTAFSTSLASLPNLQDLHLHLEGADPSFRIVPGQGAGGGLHVSAAFHIFTALLGAYAPRPAAPLQHLDVTQRLPASVWQRACAPRPLPGYHAAILQDRRVLATRLGGLLACILQGELTERPLLLPRLQSLRVRFTLEAGDEAAALHGSDSDASSDASSSESECDPGIEDTIIVLCAVSGSGAGRQTDTSCVAFPGGVDCFNHSSS